MGHTHYFTIEKEFEAEKFKAFSADCKKLADSLGIMLGDARGKGDPIFTDDEVCFNGRHEDDRCHETFAVRRDGTGFQFCKTAANPYDIVVCCCLIAMKHHFPDVEISSDGGKEG